MRARHTLAALAHPRAQWPTRVARWATSGAAAVELLTCLSTDELTAVIASGRQLSAVLLDGARHRIDDRLVATVKRCGARPIGVDDLDAPTDWERLGVDSVLHGDFGRDDLVELLDTVCDTTAAHHRIARSATLDTDSPTGTVIAVCGPGGCGSSVVSMALAQGFAGGASDTDPPGGDARRRVTLVDGARRAHQALFHHTGDVIPGLPDLLGRIQLGTFDPGVLRDLTFPTARGYRILLGSPTAHESTLMGTRAVDEALSVVARHNDIVVVDHDGCEPMGPVSAALSEISSVWVIVTTTGIKGLHDAVRFAEEAAGAGVRPNRVMVVCNRVRRRDPARVAFPVEFARITRAIGLDVAPVVMLPEVRLEAVHRDTALLPRSVTNRVTNRVRRLSTGLGAPQRSSGAARPHAGAR